MKKDITDDKLVRKYKTQQERLEYLAGINPKVNKIIPIKEALPDIFLKYIDKKPSKEFIENIKSQSWYQVECPRCKYSNRKWLEEKRNAHDYPISMKEIVNKKGLKIFYWCSNCKISWRG